MNITFLLGNGFDRALGLKTGYSDFYEWYCKKTADSDVVRKFRKSIDQDIKNTDENTPKLWSDAELGLAAVTEKYGVEDFVTCCEDMHNMLTEYLTEQDSKFITEDEKFSKIIQTFSSQLIEFQQDMKTREQQLFTKLRDDNKEYDSVINFITLNYTSTCDKIHKALSVKALSSWTARNYTHVLKMGKIVHAHGYLDNFPILGVCNPSLIANQQYLDDPAFRVLMIKKESIDAIGETWREDTNTIINGSNVICIFGASLGESDSDYWESIGNWLKNGTSRRLVIFWYDTKIKNTNISIYEKYTTEKKIQNKFLGFTNFDEKLREELRNRIHIVVNAPHMFTLPEELRIKYPVPKTTQPVQSTTLLETIEHQQQLEETIIRSNQIHDNLNPTILQKVQEITKTLPTG